MKLMKLIILIPAYNEEESISFTLNKLLTILKELENELKIEIHVCLINDGSTDRTVAIASSYPITILHQEKNQGFSYTIANGYRYAYEQGYDFAIRMDADGQHSEQDLKSILLPLVKKEADFVIGSRYLQKTNYQGSYLRRLATWLFSKHIRLLIGLNITDPVSGFRGVNRKILKTFSDDQYQRECAELGAIIYIKEKGFCIKEVSVQMRPRYKGESKIQPSRYIQFFIKENEAMLMEKLISYHFKHHHFN